jgi:hypothetical protein
MSDLDLVDRFRADLPSADPAALSRARARMFQEPPPRRRVRWAWRLAPAGALAAAVAVAVAAGGVSHPKTPPKHDAAPAPHSAAPTGPRIATDAAGVLRLAADEVRTAPALPAKPGQFVYVETLDATDNVVNLETKPKWVPPKPTIRKIWLAVDGVRPGLLREFDAKTGKQIDELATDAHTVPAYVRDLPTDPKAMLAWLRQGDAGTYSDGSDAAAWGKIGDTLREQYVTPPEQAALFEAAARFKGITLVKRADLAGRKGVAVSRLYRGVRSEYIFDARTYDFLGERIVVVGDLPPYPKGVVSSWTARLRVAIVDRAGQLP